MSANLKKNLLFFMNGSHPVGQFAQKMPALANIEHKMTTDLEEIRSWDKYGKIDGIITLPVGAKQVFPTILKENNSVQWMHSIMAGVDAILVPELVNSDIILTNAKGAYSEGLAEFTLSMILQYYKNHTRLAELKAQKKWIQETNRRVNGQKMAIIGYGDIGFQVAKMAVPFGIEVLGVKRNPNSISEEARELCTSVHGLDELDDVLGQADIVCGVLPATPGTIKFFNDDMFAKMKKTAMFLNIGRGVTTDEKAVHKALKEGTIAYAALDVFEEEPLSEKSPLFDLENFFYSPHSGDIYETYWQDGAEIMETNLEKFIDSQDLINHVNKKQGY